MMPTGCERESFTPFFYTPHHQSVPTGCERESFTPFSFTPHVIKVDDADRL
jgi:hypothetical protein